MSQRTLFDPCQSPQEHDLPHIHASPVKLCECGCGQPAPFAKKSDPKHGITKGMVLRFVKSHQPRAKKLPITACEHTDRPHYAHGLCHPCWQKKWAKANPKANRGNEWLRRNPERAKISFKRHRMKKLYGINFEQFSAMVLAQDGKCANDACDTRFADLTAETYRRHHGLHIDHDHATGKVRGLLCTRCNATLGHIRDDIAKLRGLIVYLESHSQA